MSCSRVIVASAISHSHLLAQLVLSGAGMGTFLQKHSHMKTRLAASALSLLLCGALVTAQTKVTPPDNSYTPKQDVELGLEAAEQARQQLPIMKDGTVTSYVDALGQRLVAAIPDALQQPEFRYTFETVNVREINAFALPGGPMFVNRGMIEAAQTEGEIAGVMAHEISHVVLRHGTAQASKANKFALGQIAGAVLGAIIGGRTGNIVSQTAQFGIGTYFLKFSREYEKQADIEGAQIMARAGYDPRDMASMFRTIEKEGGSNGPEWLSDHPNPGNRSEYITKEAEALQVTEAVRDRQAFERVRAHLATLPKAPTTEEATKDARRTGTTSAPDRAPSGGVPAPSSRYTQYSEGDVFRVSVPSNWREYSDSSSVTFAPEGAIGQANGHGVFTHGVEFGVARNEAHDLQTATDELIDSLRGSNPRMSRISAYRTTSIDRNRALRATLDNVSEVAGHTETVHIVTTLLNANTLFYMIAVTPRDERDTYDPAFERVLRSIRLARG
jgi:Zn-dependent protease with chaperone function